MAVEALSGAMYSDQTKIVSKPRTDNKNVQEQSQGTGTANISITEIAAVAKSENANQMTKDQEKQQKEAPASEKQIKQAINRVNDKMRKARTRCEFSYHEETKRVSIKVIDSETQEVVREIPPEETLEMVEKMYELAGLFLDEKR